MIFRRDDFQEILKILKNTSFSYLNIEVNHKNKMLEKDIKEFNVESYIYKYILHLKNNKITTYKVMSILNNVEDYKYYEPPAREKDYVSMVQQRINIMYETKGPQLLSLLTKEYNIEDVNIYFTREPNDIKMLIYKLDMQNK